MDTIKTPIGSVKLPTPTPLTFHKTSESSLKRLTVLIYGPPGSGKTHFIGTFPKPFVLDCQGGMATLRHKDVSYYAPTSYNELLKYATGLSDTDFETVALDTATEAARIIMDTAISGVREIPQMQDWLQTIERVRQLLRKFLDTKKHVVVSCEESVDKDEDTGKILMSPSLPGKLKYEAGALFDCVFHLRSGFRAGTQEKQQMILTKPEGLYQQVKQRSLGLDKLEIPDFEVIWKKANAIGVAKS